MTLGIEGNWIGIHDMDIRAIELYRRHYSANPKSNNKHGIVGPGEKMVLITPQCDALFVWKLFLARQERKGIPDKRTKKRIENGVKPKGYGGTGQTGIMCSVFRNEGQLLSSTLILEAEELAIARWQPSRFFTYVWDSKVESVNPGYCFKMAGWKTCGRNADSRLTILEKILTPYIKAAYENLH